MRDLSRSRKSNANHGKAHEHLTCDSVDHPLVKPMKTNTAHNNGKNKIMINLKKRSALDHFLDKESVMDNSFYEDMYEKYHVYNSKTFNNKAVLKKHNIKSRNETEMSHHTIQTSVPNQNSFAGQAYMTADAKPEGNGKVLPIFNDINQIPPAEASNTVQTSQNPFVLPAKLNVCYANNYSEEK